MSKSTVTTSDEKELARAVKNKVDLIIVEFDLAKKVFRIKATGKVAWAIAIGAIIAVIAVIVGTSGLAIPLATTTFGMPAVGILGLPACCRGSQNRVSRKRLAHLEQTSSRI